MSRLLILMLLASLFFAMIGAGVAHAAEPLGEHKTATAAQAHGDGDGEGVPGSVKGYPHHHMVCHGHDLTAPAKAGGPPPALRAAGPLPRFIDAITAGALLGVPLRPPMA